MKNVLLVIGIIIILIIVLNNKPKIPDISNSNLLNDLSNPSPILNNQTNAISTLAIPVPKLPAAPSITSINPDLIKYGNGILQVKQPNGTTLNLPYQYRDPLEARQPPTITITDDSSSVANIDQVLVAALPGNKRQLPSVSLGPSVSQQAQGIISFYTSTALSGFDGNGSDRGGQVSVEGGRAIEGFV